MELDQTLKFKLSFIMRIRDVMKMIQDNPI